MASCTFNPPTRDTHTLALCPPGFEGAFVPKAWGSTTGCCVDGTNRSPDPSDQNCYPLCKPAGTSPETDKAQGARLRMCPSAQVADFVSQSNALTSAAPYMAAGMCVDTQRLSSALVEGDCPNGRPTQCVMRASDKSGTLMLGPDGQPEPWYSCLGGADADKARGVRCLPDQFVCDKDAGLCRHASVAKDIKTKGGDGTPMPYQQCMAQCPAQRFTCNADTGACDPDPNGALSYVDCTTDATKAPKCANKAAGPYRCDGTNGCVPDPTGTYAALADCSAKCVQRCTGAAGACGPSDDATLTPVPAGKTCDVACPGTPPDAATGLPGWALALIIVACCLVVVGLLAWIIHRRRARA